MKGKSGLFRGKSHSCEYQVVWWIAGGELYKSRQEQLFYLMGLNNILIYMRFGLISSFYFWLWRSFTWMLLIRNVSSVNVTSVTVGAILFIPLPSVLFLSGHVSGCLFVAEVVCQAEWLMDGYWWSQGRYPLSSVYWTVASNTNFSL